MIYYQQIYSRKYGYLSPSGRYFRRHTRIAFWEFSCDHKAAFPLYLYQLQSLSM